MFKLIASFAIVAMVIARPGLLGTQTSLATIGTAVHSIPTAITHQSQSQIHTQPIVSQVLSPIVTSLAVPSYVQQTGSILSAPLLSSQILSSSLLGQGQGQILSTQDSTIGNQASLLDEQTSILGDQGSLIRGEDLLLQGQLRLLENSGSLISGQSLVGRESRLLTDSINVSSLKLNGLRQY